MRFHDARYDPGFATLIVVGDAHARRARRRSPRERSGLGAAAHRVRAERSRRRRRRPDDRLVLVPSPRRGAVGNAHRPRLGDPQHARLPCAAHTQHDPRRPVRQPDQHEPAREEGVHLRRAYQLRSRRGAGPFVLQASVQSEATTDAVREAIGELEAIRGDRPVTHEELLLGRAALTRGYPRNFETGEQIARARGAALALRSAGRLLLDVRADGARRSPKQDITWRHSHLSPSRRHAHRRSSGTARRSARAIESLGHVTEG